MIYIASKNYAHNSDTQLGTFGLHMDMMYDLRSREMYISVKVCLPGLPNRL